MAKKKHVIWGNIDLDYEDWREDLEADYPNLTEEERIEIMRLNNADYLDDERMNLDVALNRDIIVIANLGLWNGPRTGYKVIKSGNIKDCLSDAVGDFTEWYVDGYGNLRCIDQHHDGTNTYLYRVVREGISEGRIDSLLDEIYNGEIIPSHITAVTEAIGPYIAGVYGFSIRGGAKQAS